ncbi:MAG: hypothetical protein GX608_09535 [Lentisphaerae bacterium]|nr:hypothetical protein [Lentisphaerota bacterium]
MLVLYGPEWGYVKLWQQLKDFRDWRIMEKEAALDVYNLTGAPSRASFRMRGMALNGGKRVAAQGGYHHGFRHLQLTEFVLEDIHLEPGLNRIRLSDAAWNLSKIPLLVDQVGATLSGVGR